MNVNVEFLGKEPIENVITAMHFKIDKMIFFSTIRAGNSRKPFWRKIRQKGFGDIATGERRV